MTLEEFRSKYDDRRDQMRADLAALLASTRAAALEEAARLCGRDAPPHPLAAGRPVVDSNCWQCDCRERIAAAIRALAKEQR